MHLGARNLSCLHTAFLDLDVVCRTLDTLHAILSSRVWIGYRTSSILIRSRGFSMSLWQVIVGRFVAGIGGAGMVALISVMITGENGCLNLMRDRQLTPTTDTASLKQVAMVRSFVNVASIAGRSSGPPLGGFMADTIGWRW